MTNLGHIHRYELNTMGQDFVIGDIHGCFTKVEQALKKIGFNPEVDRLFSVVDLVDRGPESEDVLQWVNRLHAVSGNHDDMAVRWPNGKMDVANYLQNGGAWNISNPRDLQIEIAETLKHLPLGIEVDTPHGLVGIVHAEVPFSDWDKFRACQPTKQVAAVAQWAREKIQSRNRSFVGGVHAVFCGHTPVSDPVQLGNTFYIDTAGWHNQGVFTVANLTKMEFFQ